MNAKKDNLTLPNNQKNKKVNPFVYDLKNNKNLLLMVFLGMIMVFVFNYLPMFGIVVAFKDYSIFKGVFKSEWVGLRNFIDFFNDPYFFRLIKNTFLLGFFTFLFTFPAPIFLALMINELKDGVYKRISQTITYLPYFISTIVVVGMLKELFSADGVANNLLAAFGRTEPIYFFNESSMFRPLYVGSQVWKTVGYSSIIYLAALSGIDPQLYEAATIDGASRWHKIWKITIPSISQTIVVLLILNAASIVRVGFEKVFLMYSPATYETADVLATYVYRRGIENRDYSFGASIDLINSCVSMILVIATNSLAKRISGKSIW